ncbi:MAG: DUF2520 domain-containing protein [Anaerolineae bacterium]|nr:DUF2520 domain-containing protein [Anaerolineae bacterium]
MTRPTIGIIGAGKVGGVLARLLKQAGYEIGAVYSRSNAEALAQAVDAEVTGSSAEVVAKADLVLLAVPDDVIQSVAVALEKANWQGKGVVHTSGVHDADLLVPLVSQGAMIGSLHPAFPFTEAAVSTLAGVTFAIEAADETLRGWLIAIVDALEGNPFLIPPGEKALYHAALVFASNYTVTLYAVAETLLRRLGAEPEAAEAALNALMVGTVANLQAKGVPGALTGPLVRGDSGTVEAHLAALEAVDSPLAEVYRLLAQLSLPMVKERGVPVDVMGKLFAALNKPYI